MNSSIYYINYKTKVDTSTLCTASTKVNVKVMFSIAMRQVTNILRSDGDLKKNLTLFLFFISSISEEGILQQR